MRKLLLILFALVAAGVAAWLLPAQEEGKPPGRVTLSWTATYTGRQASQSHYSIGGGDYSESSSNDQIKVTFQGTTRWKITSLMEDTEGVPLKRESGNSTYTVSGSGQFIEKTVAHRDCGTGAQPSPRTLTSTTTTTWTYQGGGATEGGPGVELSLHDGWYQVKFTELPSYEATSPGKATSTAQTCQGTETSSSEINGLGTAGIAGWLDILTDPEAMDKWEKRLAGKFPPDSKSFSASGSTSSSYTSPPDSSGATMTGTLEFSYTLSLNAEPVEVEAVLFPEDGYGKWLPRADLDKPDWPGETLQVRVALQKKGQPGEAPAQGARFKFQLLEVSREKGVCLNWPSKAEAKDTHDLKITPEENPGLTVAPDGQSAETGPGLHEASVIIVSYDFGAYGRLRVIAALQDGNEVVAHLQNQPDKPDLTLPRDDNGNHIADAWEDGLGMLSGRDATADEDSLPEGDKHTGDGLSLYEEYRGFRVSGAHTRTDPDIKDIFIRDPNKLGVGRYAVSGIHPRLVGPGEIVEDPDPNIPNPWVVNFNRGFQSLGKVHGLSLEDANLNGLGGVAECFTAGLKVPGVPKTCRRVLVDRARCLASPWKEEEAAYCVAHELAHASNVWHHGGGDYDITSLGKKNADGTWRSVPFPAGVRSYTVAVRGGQESGVEGCIMRYRAANLYEAPGGHYRWTKPGDGVIEGEWYPPAEEPGTSFCNKREGTGVNDPRGGSTADGRKLPKAGNASEHLGECRKQFCVNDMKH